MHVALGKVFLGAVLVAVGLSGLILARLAAQGLEELAFRFMAIGFVFETLMLVSGAVWAESSTNFALGQRRFMSASEARSLP